MYENSVELLNKAVTDELVAVHQYMYFHFHCDDQGLDLLAGLYKRTAMEEMLHIEKIAERILFLKGDVDLNAAAETEKIHDVKEMLNWAVRSETDAIKAYNQSAIECGNNADSITKKLFEELVADEERHFGRFDDELGNMEKFGENYLVLQSIERSRNTSSGGGGAGN